MTKPALALILIWTLALSAVAQQPRAQAAIADRAAYCAEADFQYITYIDTDPWVGKERDDLEAAVKFMVASAFSADLKHVPIIESVMPAKIAGTSLLRIDLRELGWRVEDWREVVRHHPYTDKDWPLIIRADWLLVELADLHDSESDAYMRLVFGEKQPKTRDEVLSRLGVFNDRRFVYGAITSKSPVSKQGTRVVEFRPVLGGAAAGTFDTLKLTPEFDPLENVLEVARGQHKHNGEEWLVFRPIMSMTPLKPDDPGGHRGSILFGFLANAEGGLVDRAPADLVEDFLGFRGQNFKEIRPPGACIQCHETGFNAPQTNDFHALAADGEKGPVYAYIEDAEAVREIQAFHLSDIKKNVERNNDDYQTTIELITALPAKEFAAAFKRAITAYDRPVDMLQFAEEFTALGWEVKDVVAAIEDGTNSGAFRSLRLASVARDRTIPRDAVEDVYLEAVRVIDGYMNRN